MTKLALLWHMHQPYYEDRATGEHILPWVRLHAIKDYWGMPALLGEFPDVRVTFNVVPSLVVQIEAFAADRANDRHLRLGMKPAHALDADERRFLVENGFHAPYERMIQPHTRYTELHARKERPGDFTEDELRDLQVLHKLAWMDPDWLTRDRRLRHLVSKQRGYSEGDKRQLREIELEILNAVIPTYREAAARGNVELSTSPFYHPILPLLCNSDVHFAAHPLSALPRQLFAYPADADDQLARAFDYHEQVFGDRPRGVWPSEGSLSDAVVKLLAGQGTAWTATDEAILGRSLGRAVTADDLYRPYTLGAGPVRALFRDHQLSDLIGFTYQSWNAEEAAADFVSRVREAGRRFVDAGGGGEAVVTVILDGENAWEHYPGGGRPFLRALYQRLREAPDVQTVTMSEAVAGPARNLPTVFPGSWIDGDFYIWAGHQDDHRAWSQLAAARAAFAAVGDSITPAAVEAAREELYIAEGSDWFWWYGDDHSSDHDREFDDLFRRHIRNAYRALGTPAPAELHRSNITAASVATGLIRLGLLASPAVDGRARDFSQWAGAVDVLLSGTGTMHRGERQLVRGMRVTADRRYLYLQIAGPELVTRLRESELSLAVWPEETGARPLEIKSSFDGYDAGARWSADEVVTVALPFDALGGCPGGSVRLTLLVTKPSGEVVEQHPHGGGLAVEVPSATHDWRNWSV